MADTSSCKIPYDSDAVSTAEAKQAVTEGVTEELTGILEQLLAQSDRDEQVTKLEELKKSSSEVTRNFLRVTALREVQHSDFMKYLLEYKVPYFTEEVRKGRNLHDYSKDNLFYFAAASFFDGGVKTPTMDEFKTQELNRHYVHESHHPEYENFHDRECDEFDLIEMAVDRLARNVQYGNGIVDMTVMSKFLPRFPKGDNNAKQALYMKYCEEFVSTVQDEFAAMFPNTKEWAKKK